MSQTPQVEAWMAQAGLRAAEVLRGGEKTSAKYTTRQVSRSAICLVFKVETGDRAGALKAFNLTHEDASQAFEREATMLTLLGPTGLTPRFLDQDKTSGILVMEWIEGQTLTKAMTPETVTELARKTGAWLAEFARQMPRTTTRNDWFTYLSRYSELDLTALPKDRIDRLKSVRFTSLSIAKNDAFGGNFILRPDGTLAGIDFEAARRKPLGWDILLTARILLRLFPDQVDVAIAALVEGWESDPAAAEDMRDLAMIFARASAHLGSDTVQTAPD